MTTLIQCVSTKKRGTYPAKHLYNSDYFTAMKRYAIARGEPWYILSAKHGLVHPDDELAYYDEFGLSEEQSAKIAKQLSEMGVDSVHVIGGKKYTNPLTPELERRGIDVIEVAQGLKIGKRVSVLQQKTRELENHTL